MTTRIHKPLIKDGQLVAVLRPADPGKAIAHADTVLESDAIDDLPEVLVEQPHKFVGFLAEENGLILDNEGRGLFPATK